MWLRFCMLIKKHKNEENKIASHSYEAQVNINMCGLKNEFVKMNVCSLWPSFFVRLSYRAQSQVETDLSFDGIKLPTTSALVKTIVTLLYSKWLKGGGEKCVHA